METVVECVRQSRHRLGHVCVCVCVCEPVCVCVCGRAGVSRFPWTAAAAPTAQRGGDRRPRGAQSQSAATGRAAEGESGDRGITVSCSLFFALSFSSLFCVSSSTTGVSGGERDRGGGRRPIERIAGEREKREREGKGSMCVKTERNR